MYEVMFLGGAREVGRVGMVLYKEGEPLYLFDYGMKPSNPPEFPISSPPVRAAFMTHAHLDHSGMAPWIASNFGVPIYATAVSHEVASLLHRDAIKIAKIEGYPLPYGEREEKIYRERSVAIVGIDDYLELEEAKVRTISAGHIPGSVMFRLELETGTMMFTGDINTVDTYLLEGTKGVKADTLIVEGTYSGREHPDRKEVEKEFLDKIDEVLSRGGKVVVPAFAVGRSQEVLIMLSRRGYNIWMDGMGKQVTRIYLSQEGILRDKESLRRAFEQINLVENNGQRKKALERGDVIVTTSGMLDGGPVLYYISQIRGDKRSAILLTGYQVEGSNGRGLLENRRINIQGIEVPVEAEVNFYDFSAHAGHSDLVKFIKSCSPERVIVFHSDNALPLVEEIQDFAEAIIPDITIPIPLFS